MMFEDKIDLIIKRITDSFDPKAIIVFGSVAKGTSSKDSDLDVAVIIDTELSEHDRYVKMRICIGAIGIPLDLLVFTPKEIEMEKENKYSIVSEIMKTGEVVYGVA